MSQAFDPSDLAGATAASCPFCAIASSYAPAPPTSPTLLDADKTSPPTYLVLSTPVLIAFLDIAPLSRGHLLLCPRSHRPKLTSLAQDEAAELGRYLPVLSEALVRATGVPDWNVVQNNGAAAAQVVMHAHFHLIPRPEIRASGRFSSSFTMFGRGRRTDLDDDDAAALAADLRKAVGDVMGEMGMGPDNGSKSKL